MKTRSTILSMMIAVSCLLTPRSFAQDYAQVNIFNHFTDWTVTLGKNPDEKQRIINDRIQLRAHNREAWDHRKDHEQNIQAHKDEENKKFQDEDRDHQAKMDDL